MKRVARGCAIPLAVFAAWEIMNRAGALPMDTLSRPSHIALAAARGFADGSIPRATWYTLEAAFVGFAIAAALGILLGVLLGLSPKLERVVSPSIEALRPVPSVALMPLSLLLFGFGLQMEAFVVAFACVWPVLLVTISAVHGIEPRLLDVARTLELSFAARTRKVILPAALGRIAVGLRLAFGISLVVAVTVEIVMNPRGLGYEMITAQQSLKPELMYAQLLWLGVLGWALNFAAAKAVARWPGAGPGGAA
jgi:NitT/TauT family transport system permease protein